MSFLPPLKRLYNEFSEDRVPAVAAGITFFFLLALFPAIASVVSLYGLVADRHSIIRAVHMASGFLPEGAVRVLRTDIYRLASQEPEKLGWAFGFSLLIAVWSASGGIKALIDGLNVAFETQEKRSFLHLTVNTLLFTALATVLAAAGVYIAISGSDLVDGLPFANVLVPVLKYLVWPAGFLICSTVISLIYRFGPNRPGAPWRWITWGSTFTAAAWIAGTVGFSWYVAHFGKYDRTYGDLGAAVGFLTWVWLSLVILLTGAEIVCETERLAEPKSKRARRKAPHKEQAQKHPAARLSSHHGQTA
jgi:membrane protein